MAVLLILFCRLGNAGWGFRPIVVEGRVFQVSEGSLPHQCVLRDITLDGRERSSPTEEMSRIIIAFCHTTLEMSTSYPHHSRLASVPVPTRAKADAASRVSTGIVGVWTEGLAND